MNAMSGFRTELKTTCWRGQDKPKRDSLAGWKSLACKITRTFSLTGHLMHPLFNLKLFLKRKKKKDTYQIPAWSVMEEDMETEKKSRMGQFQS